LVAQDSTESNENDKNLPLYLEVLRKIRICAFAVLHFWQNGSFQKKSDRAVSLEGNQGVRKCRLGELTSRSRFGVLRTKFRRW